MYPHIKELRTINGYTQSKLGELLGCSQRMYCDYERGISDVPTDILIKLSRIYNVSTDYILGLEDNEMNKKVCIYQLKDNSENDKIMFMSFSFVENKGIELKKEMYDLIYEYKMEKEISNINMFLERVYKKFNLECPKDYNGHSLSVSDIIVIKDDVEEKAYYVDSFGFKEVEFHD